MLKKIFDYVIANGETTKKKNILTIFSGKNDNVYTKKISLGNKNLRISGCFVKYISLSSNDGKFDDVNQNDLRVNFKNYFNEWVNVPAHTLPDVALKELVECLNIK